jgi:hypothetical protein
VQSDSTAGAPLLAEQPPEAARAAPTHSSKRAWQPRILFTLQV